MLRETRTGSQDDGGFAKPRMSRFANILLGQNDVLYLVSSSRKMLQLSHHKLRANKHKLGERSDMVKFLPWQCILESDIGVPRSSPSASAPRRKLGTK